jgi:hypothetical protein
MYPMISWFFTCRRSIPEPSSAGAPAKTGVKDSKVEAQVPRSDLRARALRRRFLWAKVEVTDAIGTPVARMPFPLPARGDAALIAKALGAPPITR